MNRMLRIDKQTSINGRAGERIMDRTLSEQQKKQRVVLKRVNLDTWGVRTDFLRSGTMARGAAETGKVGGPEGIANHGLPFVRLLRSGTTAHRTAETGEVRAAGGLTAMMQRLMPAVQSGSA